MANIRDVNTIILGMLDYLKTSQPNLDVKPGSVARDLTIDLPASTIALLYDELSKISNLQSLRLVAASDLDKLAQNFGASRKAASKASGVALLTFASIPAVISITSGSLITALNGSTYTVQNGLSINPSQANSYKSTAVKYQSNLSFLGITDQYAAEVSVQASTAGSAGNVAQYALNSTAIAGVSNVTNTFPFTGGTDQENDSTFRNRVLAIFSGSNIGTSLGYKNLALSNSAVNDAIVIGPGDPLMTRDGAVVIENPDGSYTIISEGTGGKVDIVILGSVLTQFTDTFIYRDQSNTNDPTNVKNNFILGQIVSDVGKTITQKRIDDIQTGILPAQPVEQILEVTGSLSGANFIPMSTDSLGRITGNYELIKDTGSYAGSPWGFDTFHWVSNQISFNEDIVKSKFNGQDATTFSGVLEIPNITQNISISNENSIVLSSNNSTIQLLHQPATNVTRVFNVNTGENYTVTNQNLNGTGSTNTTGQIQISGSTLPSTSDILQVDYTWIVSYDAFSDYDGKILNNNPRPSIDSVDWGISNAIRDERILFTVNSTNTLFTGTTKHPITSVISANLFAYTRGTVVISNVPNFSNRLMINIATIDTSMDTIESVKLSNSIQEVYDTAENDGFVINNRIAVGSQIKYNAIILLPTDTTAVIGSEVSVTYNPIDVFNVVNNTGSSTGNQVTLPVGNIPNASFVVDTGLTWQVVSNNSILASGTDGYITPNISNPDNANFQSVSANFSGIANITNYTIVVSGSVSPANNGTFKISSLIDSHDITIQNTYQVYLDVSYIASLQNLLTTGITSFPLSRTGNGYLTNNNVGSINTIKSNTIKRENQTIQLNTSNQPYITLSILSTDFSLTQGQVVSVIDLASSNEIWNTDYPGIVSTNSNGNYVLTFTGLNSPVAGDNVLAIYFADDINRVQPFTFSNEIYKVDFQSLLFNFTTNNFYLPIQNFIAETGILFNVIDNTTGLVIGAASDGYISTVSGSIATFNSISFNFSNIDDLTGKSIRLINTINVNNKGRYEIISYISPNTITIGISVSNLNINQISVIRIQDNKDLWTPLGTIDPINNMLDLQTNTLALQNDKVVVIIYGNKPLHQSPTKLSITVADQIVNTGIITASGTTVTQVASIVFTAINNGLQQNALEALKTFLGLTSNSTISSSNYIVRVVKVQKVSTTTSNQILNTIATYDVLGTSLLNTTLYPNEMLENMTLQNTEFILPSTTNNIANAPSIGDKLLITFYYATDNDFENIYFTKNGTLYTNKKFAFLNELFVSSGFNSSQSTRFTVAFFTQPATGSRYTAFYNYTAPKQNERILINYNYNQLIATTTLTVENARPINADVLVREAKQLLIDATLNIVVLPTYSNSSAIVIQNVQNAITSTINTETLGAVLNSSDLIAAAQAVSGVSRVRILYFNIDGTAGQVLTITCQEDQYFVANNVIVNQETA